MLLSQSIGLVCHLTSELIRSLNEAWALRSPAFSTHFQNKQSHFPQVHHIIMSSTVLLSPFPHERPSETAQLLEQDKGQLTRLLASRETDGFLYLDISGYESRGL